MKRIFSLSLMSLFLTFPVYGQDVAEPASEVPDVTQASEQALEDEDPFTDSALDPSVDSNVELPEVPPAPADQPAQEEQPAQEAQPDSEFMPAEEDQAAVETESNAEQGNAPLAETAAQLAEKDLKEGDEQVAQREEAERLSKEKEKKELEEKQKQRSRIDIWELIKSGGFLMWPLGVLSVLGLMFILERFIALRYNAIMPRRLFRQMLPYLEPTRFSPTAIWAICNKYRSPAARVIQAALLKIGRPLPEIVSAVEAAKQDEASNMYRNVGWLTLVSSLAPLLGLLGTVWGMIEAFHMVASLEIGANRAEQLSNGIYVALVTTAAGLAIAIPVALFAHFFESRILKAMHKLDSKLLPLYDILERQEGKPRISLSQYQGKR